MILFDVRGVPEDVKPLPSAGGPNLEVGQRYLVAGEDHFVWACGYTQQYDVAVAAQWAAAAGS